MYSICRMLDGTFIAQFGLQDSTERKTCKGQDEAIGWIAKWARMKQRNDFTAESIKWWQEVRVREVVTDVDGQRRAEEYNRIEEWCRKDKVDAAAAVNKERSSTENGGEKFGEYEQLMTERGLRAKKPTDPVWNYDNEDSDDWK